MIVDVPLNKEIKPNTQISSVLTGVLNIYVTLCQNKLRNIISQP